MGGGFIVRCRVLLAGESDKFPAGVDMMKVQEGELVMVDDWQCRTHVGFYTSPQVPLTTKNRPILQSETTLNAAVDVGDSNGSKKRGGSKRGGEDGQGGDGSKAMTDGSKRGGAVSAGNPYSPETRPSETRPVPGPLPVQGYG